MVSGVISAPWAIRMSPGVDGRKRCVVGAQYKRQ